MSTDRGSTPVDRGEWVDTPEHKDGINPLTGEVIGQDAIGRALTPGTG